VVGCDIGIGSSFAASIGIGRHVTNLLATYVNLVNWLL